MIILNNFVYVCRFLDHNINILFTIKLQFVKSVFPAKIWFVKTSTRIVNYESLVAKSNHKIVPSVGRIYQ